MRYRKCFPDLGIPWLGMPFGQPEYERDVTQLPVDVTNIRLTKKSRNVDQLSRLRRVRVLSFSYFEPAWIESLEQLPKLEIISFSGLRLEQLPSFRNLSRLRILIAARCSRLSLNFLRKTGIHSLCLGDFKRAAPLNLGPIGTLGDLRELYISGNPAVKSLTPLGRLAELRYLFLFINTKQGLPDVKPLGKLQRLDFAQLSPGLHVEQLDYLLDRWPRVRRIELNAGLSWPPPGPREARQQSGRISRRVVQDGSRLSLDHD